MRYIDNLGHPVFWALFTAAAILYITCCVVNTVKSRRERREWEEAAKNLKTEEKKGLQISGSFQVGNWVNLNKKDKSGQPMTNPCYLCDDHGGYEKCSRCNSIIFVRVSQYKKGVVAECCQCGVKLMLFDRRVVLMGTHKFSSEATDKDVLVRPVFR